MRLPLIWKPSPRLNISPAEVSEPVGHLDLAQTFCHIAGIDKPHWVEGKKLPTSNEEARAQQRSHVITEWDSQHGPVDIHLKSIFQDGWLCTAYGKSSLYEGTEGELYDLKEDPNQLINLWSDQSMQPIKSDLIADLKDKLPPDRQPRLERKATV